MEYIKLIDKGKEKEIAKKLKKILKAGGTIIIPTDTVYGLAADASNEEAVRKIYELKQREFSNPMSILVANQKMIKKVTKQISDTEEKIIKRFFPGALTMILEKSDCISNLVTAGRNTVRS